MTLDLLSLKYFCSLNLSRHANCVQSPFSWGKYNASHQDIPEIHSKESEMRREVTAFIFAILLGLGTMTSVEADTIVNFPDGSTAFTQFVGPDQLAFIFWDTATTGDNDIFTLHSDSIANPSFLALGNEPDGLSYWLNFIGFDIFGNMIYDVQVNQGNGWFFIGQILL